MPSPVFRSISVTFMLTLSAVTGFALGDRVPPVERISGEIIPAKARPGEMVTVKWKANIHRRCHGDIHRTIKASDGSLLVLENDVSSYETGGDYVSRGVRIPLRTPPGPARYHAQVKFICNPVHAWWPITVEGPDLPFEVLEP